MCAYSECVDVEAHDLSEGCRDLAEGASRAEHDVLDQRLHPRQLLNTRQQVHA
jgi:hypothetical protein